jgi:D-inositol-3-phosphate glycosyltransferase
MHTMAKVKNLALADGDVPEPAARAIGESQVVEVADRLLANTDDEAHARVELYGAEPERVVTVPPGVDLDLFRPGSKAAARARFGTVCRRAGPALRRAHPAAQGARRAAAGGGHDARR